MKQDFNILAVDDDPDMLRFYSAILGAQGLGVVECKSGEEAITRMEDWRPELIIADVNMPDMNGIEFCRRVRALGHDDVPFIFSSALGTLQQRLTGLRAGADDYMVKPIEAEELLLKVHRLVEKSRKYRKVVSLLENRQELGVISGDLAQVDIPYLIQIIDYLQLEDAVLRLYQNDRVVGEAFIADKMVLHARVGELAGIKAFYRMLTVVDGAFKLEACHFDGEVTIGAPVEQCLLGGLAHVDETNRLRQRLGAQGGRLVVNYGPDLFGRSFSDGERDLFKLIDATGDLDQILDACADTDLEALRLLAGLVDLGLVKLAQRQLDS